MIRQARVAGQFYPANPRELKIQLEALIGQSRKRVNALGVIVPHAGYIYSGAVAAACFGQVNLTNTVIVLGPNHSGLGKPFSIVTKEMRWQTPLGQVQVDYGLADMIMNCSQYLVADIDAHLDEHSIEVQLPFLQYLASEVKIVPIVLADAGFKVYAEIGQAIAQSLKRVKQNCLIVASSDMSHYQSETTAKENDRLAIEAILNLDPSELLNRITKFKITMCGYAPVACMLYAVKQLTAQKAELIKYQTSGDITGDRRSVVGYAGIIIQ